MNTADQARVSITADSQDATLSFAMDEIRRMLGQTGGVTLADEGAEWNLILRVDSLLPEGSFGVTCPQGSREVILSGRDTTCALHAAYTALERLGFVFDLSGPTAPDSVDLAALDGWSSSAVPVVRNRGVRQHINFPMDISSYPIEEAKEYIRNLARLRMNFIAFHSYPGQWYEAELPSKKVLAGGFFYNRTHVLPDHPAFRQVRNSEVFCIPEVEPVFGDRQRRSAAAVAWLREVMCEAKRVGMKVQFSFEPRDASVEDCVATARAICAQYPMIDKLELITQEVGGDFAHPAPTIDELTGLIGELFGEGALRLQGVRDSIGEGLWQLPGTLRELAKNIRVLGVLNELHKARNGLGSPGLAAGIYCTDHTSLRMCLALMRKLIPEEIDLAFLPAHGARASAESVANMGLEPSDLRRTIIYSWIEFDGDMFLQENTVFGTRQMLDRIAQINGREQVYTLAFNHWRTVENRTGARYAAEACIQGQMSVPAFYSSYALSLGVAEPETYACAMHELDEVDDEARNRLGNIGFCFEPCWHQGVTNLGYVGSWTGALLDEMRGKFEAVHDKLGECLRHTDSAAARDYLTCLINRLECTSLHLRAMAKLVELQPICMGAEPAGLTDAQQQQVRSICDEALSFADSYLSHYARVIADRGCEGTLVSYYDTVVVFISKLRALYGGELVTDSILGAAEDAPPSPAILDLVGENR